MRINVLVVAALASCLSGCVTTPVGGNSAPDPFAPKAAAFGAASPDAPAEITQFGRFAGRWKCGVNERRPDGSWRSRPDNVIWTFFYTLNGLAVQDIWASDDQARASEGIATNLRVYNALTGTWNVSWTNTTEAVFEYWNGEQIDDELVLTSFRDQRPVKIRFFNILPRQFQWSYEAATSRAGTEFMPVMQLLCQLQD